MRGLTETGVSRRKFVRPCGRKRHNRKNLEAQFAANHSSHGDESAAHQQQAAGFGDGGSSDLQLIDQHIAAPVGDGEQSGVVIPHVGVESQNTDGLCVIGGIESDADFEGVADHAAFARLDAAERQGDRSHVLGEQAAQIEDDGLAGLDLVVVVAAGQSQTGLTCSTDPSLLLVVEVRRAGCGDADAAADERVTVRTETGIGGGGIEVPGVGGGVGEGSRHDDACCDED